MLKSANKTKISEIDGLKVITEQMEDSYSVSINLLVKVGSRYEDMSNNGISHFVEHLAFKGTKKRTAYEIAMEFDSMSGQYNACASNEYTMFYCHVLKEDAYRALDILCDTICNSIFDEKEVESERGVIFQEMAECFDNPTERASDIFMNTAYSGQALGRDILGTRESISIMQRKEILNFVKKYYCRDRIIISACGNVEHENFCSQVKELMKGLKKSEEGSISHESAQITFENAFEARDLKQAHCIIGFSGNSFVSRKHFYSEIIFNMIFGQGMSSILFQEIREKRGLVYSIYSYTMQKKDTGMNIICFSSEISKVKEISKIIVEQILSLYSKITLELLNKAKYRLKAQLALARESTSSIASSLVKQYLYYGGIKSIEESYKIIDEIDLQCIIKICNDLSSNIRNAVTVQVGGSEDQKGCLKSAFYQK